MVLGDSVVVCSVFRWGHFALGSKKQSDGEGPGGREGRGGGQGGREASWASLERAQRALSDGAPDACCSEALMTPSNEVLMVL